MPTSRTRGRETGKSGGPWGRSGRGTRPSSTRRRNAAALRRAGVRTVIVCVSGRVEERASYLHRPSGATVVALRAPRPYRLLRRWMVNPYGRTAGQTFGSLRGARLPAAPLLAVAKEVAPYLSTPVTALAREVRRQACSAVLCQEYEFPRFDVCVALGRF